MNDKNDPIGEQQRRQREFIELKRAKSGETAASGPDTVERVPLTTKEKISNIWFYYKYYIIFVPLIVFTLAVFVVQCRNKPKYDYTVLLNSTQFVSDNDSERFSEYLQSIGEDVNGDGKVTVNVINCSRNQYSGDAQTTNARAQKFLVEIAGGDARIIVVNKEIFDQFNKEDLMLWTDHFSLPDMEGKALDCDNTTLECLSEYKEKYYLCYRLSDSYDTPDARLFETLVSKVRTDE